VPNDKIKNNSWTVSISNCTENGLDCLVLSILLPSSKLLGLGDPSPYE
jgi:hypothetical protein